MRVCDIKVVVYHSSDECRSMFTFYKSFQLHIVLFGPLFCMFYITEYKSDCRTLIRDRLKKWLSRIQIRYVLKYILLEGQL